MSKLANKWSAAKERNEREVQRRSRELLDDQRFDALRSPSARRALVVAYWVVTAAMTVSWYGGAIVGVVGLAVWAVAFLALRTSVRSVADMPDHLLDERMLEARNSAYVSAFRLVSAVLAAAALALFLRVIVSDANDEAVVLTVSTASANAIFWSALAIVLGAPSVAIAWRSDTRLH